MELGLTYDDVLLVPQYSEVESRSDVDISSNITPSVSLDVPIISSNMDTVTESEMAQAMHDAGGVGILHRFMTTEEQASEIESVSGTVGASVGVNEDYIENIETYLEAGADFICIDIAHGHLSLCLEAVSEISSEYPSVDLMAGNVATGEAAIDLLEAGADSIKVGIGGGSACRTREVAGVGVPQFTAVRNVAEAVPDSAHVIADGGVQKSGDIVKALMAGADAVMVGSFVAKSYEAPGETIRIDGVTYKEYRGMASTVARDNRTDVEDDDTTSEGAVARKEVKGSVSDILQKAKGGIQSGLSYCGGNTIESARTNAEFMRSSNSTITRNGVHNVDEIKGI